MSESLFSKKNMKLIKDPLNDNNPITIQVLGICSALAITVKVETAFVMAVSVLFVMIGANVIVSLLRKVIPSRIRIIVQLVIVASLVILVDQILKAFVYDVSKQLSVFVGLIITNCIIMGRLEAFALGNKPGVSFLDAVGNAFGYGLILIVVAFFRELFGSGTLTLPLVGKLNILTGLAENTGYEHNGLMILPPMALITVGVYIWVQRSRNKKLIEENH
jgi:Na+-transporting NADH:ubiquinone oxidoreductase subunit D